MNFHFWGYKQKPFPKQIGTLASENGPAGSVPRWGLGCSVSLAQEGTSSRASRSHHSQVPRDRISPDKLQQELWHGGLNPTQPKSEKQVEIRVSINARHTSSLIQARLCVYHLLTPQIPTVAVSARHWVRGWGEGDGQESQGPGLMRLAFWEG